MNIILEKLDEGFHCTFSFSGTLIEQLEKWRPDVLSLFDQVARHRNSELLGQTYYHSIGLAVLATKRSLWNRRKCMPT